MTKQRTAQRPKTRSQPAYEAIMRTGAGRHKADTDYDRTKQKIDLRDLTYEDEGWEYYDND